MIEWIDNTKDCAGTLLTFFGLIISLIAIVISIKVSRRQDRIALFDKKFEVYKSLKLYFNSTKGWPKAINKFLYPRFSMQSDNVWSPEINEIVENATLLFSKALVEKLVLIKNMYDEIRSLDMRLNSYLTLISEQSNFHVLKSQFVEYLQNDPPTDEQEKEFKELCRKSRISVNEPVDQDQYELITYDFYGLYKEQSDLQLEISILQKLILEAIMSETKPHK